MGDYTACPPLIWHIARTMVKVEEYRVQTKFGKPGNQPHCLVVPGTVSWHVKMAGRCLTVFLFGVHSSYRLRLQGSGARGAIYLADFKELLNGFIAEWSGESLAGCIDSQSLKAFLDYNLLATVFIV